MLHRTYPLIVCLLIILTARAVYGQSTGLITGTVTDPTGAVIPDASVSIKNTATGAERIISANNEGIFSAPSLAAGDYEVRVEARGFRTLVRPATVEAGPARR
jgi:hypothetical protein